MGTHFNFLLQQAIAHYADDEGDREGCLIRLAGKEGHLNAFNYSYSDGSELLFMRGHSARGFKMGAKPIIVKEGLVISFLVNIGQLKVYYRNSCQSEVQKGDAIMIHNEHAGLEAMCFPNSDFLFFAIRLTGEAYDLKKSLILNHIPNLFDNEDFVLYLNKNISQELLKLLGGVDNWLKVADDFFRPIIKTMAEECMLTCLYEMARTESTLVKYSISSDKLSLANEVRNLILSQPNEYHSIEKLAKQVGASKTILKETFQRVYGLPIYTFYQNRRIIKARQLLASGDFSITQVAYDLDFSTVSNFSKFFKKMTGLTPREYVNGQRE
ncbi:MAG: AraC family transcriptional regulator [Carboxylicivirga sp.]|jgi:AraC-like DNA-binding protein|nr:AraC family transcriptional regulator [Carboxylicivirga sp.]